jgi:predicted  nucleic acid-binding Zn-ribbon protein
MLTQTQKQELQQRQLHQTLKNKGVDINDEEISYQLDYWHALFTEINNRYEKTVDSCKKMNEIVLQAQQEQTKILNEKKELKQQIKKLKEENEKLQNDKNLLNGEKTDLESDLDISNEIIINKNGKIKGLVDKSNKQEQTINKLQDCQSYQAKKKKKQSNNTSRELII